VIEISELSELRDAYDRLPPAWLAWPRIEVWADSILTIIAYLSRNSSHSWSEAERLPVPTLYERFDKLRELIQKENDAMKRG